MLDVRGVTVRFGGRSVLSDVSIAFESGRVTGLIGPNGAGKTTLFNVISGFQAPSHGHLVLDGLDITRASATRRAKLGMARTFQRLELFGSLTVRENLEVAVGGKHGRRRDAVERVVQDLLARFDLARVSDTRTGVLPIGLGRIVELARAVAAQPRTLLLDEPTSGLDEVETRRFDVILRGLASSGLGIAVVEHDISLVMSVCDPVYVLDQGCVIAKGSPAEVQADNAVRVAYLGNVA
jgi:branched-chain amino acid transport system ATP-binding protein